MTYLSRLACVQGHASLHSQAALESVPAVANSQTEDWWKKPGVLNVTQLSGVTNVTLLFWCVESNLRQSKEENFSNAYLLPSGRALSSLSVLKYCLSVICLLPAGALNLSVEDCVVEY